MANVIEAVFSAKNQIGPQVAAAKAQVDSLNRSLLATSVTADGASTALNALGASALANPVTAVVAAITVSIAAITAGATAATEGLMNLSGTAEEINNLAVKTGLAASEVQGLQQIFGDFGVDAGSLSQGLVILNRNIANESDELKKAGITATNSHDALRQLSDLFSQMPDGPQKTALAMAAFGRAGAAFIPVLNQGAIEIDKTIARFRELGIVLSDSKLQDLGRLDDNFDAIDARFKGLSQTLLVSLLPAFEYFTGLIVVTLDKISAIPKALDDAGKAMRDFANSLPGGKQVLDLIAIGNAVQKVRRVLDDRFKNAVADTVTTSSVPGPLPPPKAPFVDDTSIQKLQRFADLFTKGLELALRPLTDSRGTLKPGALVPEPETQLTDTGQRMLENIKRGEMALLDLTGRLQGIFSQTADRIFTGTAAKMPQIIQLFVAIGDAMLKTFFDVLAEIGSKALAQGLIGAVVSLIPGLGPAIGAAGSLSGGPGPRVPLPLAAGPTIYINAIDSKSAAQEYGGISGTIKQALAREAVLERVF